jgi:hypothetical protein
VCACVRACVRTCATLLYRTRSFTFCVSVCYAPVCLVNCATRRPTTVKYSALLVTVARVLGLVRRQNIIFTASCRKMTVWDKNIYAKNYITQHSAFLIDSLERERERGGEEKEGTVVRGTTHTRGGGGGDRTSLC